ncbi:methoxymalonate biosynthesis protein [Micromonospora rosaria]|uniref:Methoxymalonate biosynthesis protein n=1 Tax=Micromonospora rosaria TaxID=47874 RepID=A0A136PMQ1_9ACTN|nr:acyl carrier protein [Micromonospora rosaria]KXK59674.1 methoxymalonate biosynthesis protein [Micromonospora rosaria]
MTTSSDRAVPETAGGSDAVQAELLRFLTARTRKPWTADADLFASGGLSSLFAMELVVHLERTYGIAIRGTDLRLENFRTVWRMAALVDRLRQPAPGGRGE